MNVHTICPDNLSKLFPAEIVAEMRRSVYPGGTCGHCAQQVCAGDRTRLDATKVTKGWNVWACHDACAPYRGEWRSHAFGSHTWNGVAGVLPTTEAQPSGASCGQPPWPELFPVLMINPSIDGFRVVPDAASDDPMSLQDNYVNLGLSRPGDLVFGAEPRHGFTGKIESDDDVAVQLGEIGSFSLPSAPVVSQEIIRRGGFLVLLTHAVSFAAECDIRRTVRKAMTATEQNAVAWVPLGS